ncbi:hypothetical protein RFI_08963, partial [Reticulomyxa filosa]
MDFKDTKMLYMYSHVVHSIDNAQNQQDLIGFMTQLFNTEELKELLRTKLNIEMEKSKNNTSDHFSAQNKICDLYLHTSSIDEILSTNVQLHIYSFLENCVFKKLKPKKKYTLEVIDYMFDARRVWNKMLQVDHKRREVLVNTFPLRAPSESDDNKTDDKNILNELGEFPWQSIHKWKVTGIQLNILYYLFEQRPVLCHRSMLEPSSSPHWKEIVSIWKKHGCNNNDPFSKSMIKEWSVIAKRDMNDWCPDIEMSTNHGFIDYSLILDPQDLQIDVTPEHIQKFQFHSLSINFGHMFKTDPANSAVKNFFHSIFCIQCEVFIEYAKEKWKNSGQNFCNYLSDLIKELLAKEREIGVNRS